MRCALEQLSKTHDSCVMLLMISKPDLCVMMQYVETDSFELKYDPDWFPIQVLVEMWHDDHDYCDEWYLVESHDE